MPSPTALELLKTFDDIGLYFQVETFSSDVNIGRESCQVVRTLLLVNFVSLGWRRSK